MKPTKTLSLIAGILLLAGSISAQTFNWEEQVITNIASKPMQNITIADDGSATMVGFGNTFVQSKDGGDSWQNTDIFEKSTVTYRDISFSGNTGFAFAWLSYKSVDRPSGGSPDLSANAPLLKTIDGGITWEQITLETMGSGSDSSLNISAEGNNTVKFKAVEVVDANIVYVAAYWKDINKNEHQNVYASSDAGATWEAIIPDNKSNHITSIIQHKDHIYISGLKTLYKVALADNTVIDLFPTISSGETKDMYFTNLSISGDELILPGYGGTKAGGIRVTSDEGASFTTITGTESFASNFVYKYDSLHIVACGGKSDTKVTSDGGTTWTLLSTGETLWNAGIVGDSLVGLGMNDIYTMAIADIAAGNFAWTKKTPSDISGIFNAIATKGDTTFIVGSKDVFAISTDNAQTFTGVTLPSKTDLMYPSVNLSMRGLARGKGEAAIASTRKYKMYDDTYVAGFLFTTTDNWASFTVLDDSKVGAKYDTTSCNPYSDGCYGQDFYSVECVNDSTYYTSVQWYDTISTEKKITYTRIFKTIDSGASWDTITSDLGSATITSITFDEEVGYIGGLKTLLKTSDGGATLENLYPKLVALADDNIYMWDVKTYGNDTLYIPSTGDGIFVSYDAGATFSLLNGVIGANTFVAIDADSWMTLGSAAKTKYTNYGNDSTWIDCYPGASAYNCTIYNDKIIALCSSSIYKLDISDLNADVIAGINDIASNVGNLNIYQSNDQLIVSSDQIIDQCTIYSISGQVMSTTNVNAQSASLSTSALQSGIYILKADNATAKFIIQ